ncbi:Sodium/proline symporter [Polystyrenella longa]|uniref:Sodium/proline symporter n=1 Tax=Polystyrenella longa TaxID=2528007 RepID=A0A518CLP2_9PLAN|nr:sodium/proline symporter [Polystyrenella longa]QDU80139.1 Sodium/proline symporter [Polystyrenella longa]
MDTNTQIVLVTLIVYKVMLISVGVWASRRTKTESDFFLAGQGLGPWTAGLSYAASTSSAWVLLGFTGFVYSKGLSALWMIPGVWGGYVAVWLFFGRRLREETAEMNHLTLTDYLTAQVSGPMRTLIAMTASVFVVFCFIFYIAAQFGAAAVAFESQFGLATNESVLIGAAVVLTYALLGGFWAVSVTDMLQGLLMAVVAISLPIAALFAAGGPFQLFSTLAESAPEGYLDITGGLSGFLLVGFVLGVWGVGIGAMGQPHLLARLMAVKDEAARMRGFAIALSWGVVVFIGMATLALSGRALVGGDSNGESLFYQLADDLLPPVLAGIVIAAVLSAVMSTVDSILLSASAAVSHDMGMSRLFPDREVLVSRIVMFLIAAVAVWMTLTIESTIFARVLFAWSALGAAFGPIVVMRVLSFEPRGLSILIAMICGFGLTVFFNALGQIEPIGFNRLMTLLVNWAHLPGDPFERVVPWIAPLALLWIGSPPRVIQKA